MLRQLYLQTKYPSYQLDKQSDGQETAVDSAVTKAKLMSRICVCTKTVTQNLVSFKMTSHNNQFLEHGTRNVVRVSHCSCHQHPVPIVREVFTISELSDNSYITICLLREQVFILAPAGPLRSLNAPATINDQARRRHLCARTHTTNTHTHTSSFEVRNE